MNIYLCNTEIYNNNQKNESRHLKKAAKSCETLTNKIVIQKNKDKDKTETFSVTNRLLRAGQDKTWDLEVAHT